jgi:hypothetical protein
MKALKDGYSIGRAISDAPDNATLSSVLMVIENKQLRTAITVDSIEGLAATATSADSFVSSTTTSYQSILSKITQGALVVTEYLSVTTKAVAGYFDKLFAKEVYTDKVCIKKSNGQDVCITGDQVEQMLNTTSLPLLTPATTLPTGAQESATTTLENSIGGNLVDTATSTSANTSTSSPGIPELDVTQPSSSTTPDVVETVPPSVATSSLLDEVSSVEPVLPVLSPTPETASTTP